jgi:hypothetical protein
MQIPFSPALEKQMYPNKDGVIAAVRRTLETSSRPADLASAHN